MTDWLDACDPVYPERPPHWRKGVDAQRRAAQISRIKQNRLNKADTVPDFFVLDDFDEMGA